jgi:transketolase
MRAEFAAAMVKLQAQNERSVFLTGDLGFMALEQVRETYGRRFINMGVAEQNMISFAAGLAYDGFVPWVYSIAPFLLLRPYEQIRNDVCLHNLPVKLVGNGGGYGYGIMGATHHTLEDIAVMRVLPNMKVFVPLTADDVEAAVVQMAQEPGPCYLRLNSSLKTAAPIEKFKQWRKIRDGKLGVVISVGPVVGNILALNDDLEVWAVGLLPFGELPPALIAAVKRTGKLLTIEEHVGQGGLNEAVAKQLVNELDGKIVYRSLYAAGYPSGRYGSQRWHQAESGLAGAGLENNIKEWLYGKR